MDKNANKIGKHVKLVNLNPSLIIYLDSWGDNRTDHMKRKPIIRYITKKAPNFLLIIQNKDNRTTTADTPTL